MPVYSFSPQFDPVSKTFQHDKGHRHEKGFFNVLALAGRFMTREADLAETEGFPVMSAADNAAPGDADDAVTWIGHATLLFEHAGKTVLTDPMFSKRASPVSLSGPKQVVPMCYIKNTSHFSEADLSYSNHCTGTTTPYGCGRRSRLARF